MKRKIFYLILALMAITTIIIIYNGSDIIPKIATKETNKINEKNEKNVSNEIMFNMNETVETSEMIFTFNTATISKKTDKLPVFKGFKNYLEHPPQIDEEKSFDENCNFIDNNNYLQLMVTWENKSSIPKEVYLNSLTIFNEKGKDYLSLEPVLTSVNLNFPKKDYFAHTLKSMDKLTFYLGYIITDEEVKKFKDNMYISLNINGTNLMYQDNNRRAIKLRID